MIKQLTAKICSVIAGCIITYGFIYLFDIQVTGLEHWLMFPRSWGFIDVFNNLLAILIFVSSIRATYKALEELWVNK